MNGFQGLLQYAKQSSDTTNAGNNIDGKATGKITAFAGKYSSDPLNLGLSHTKIVSDVNTAAATTDKAFKSDTKMTDLAANYDFGVAKVFANKFSRKTNVSAAAFYDGTIASYAGASTYGMFQDGGSLKRTGWDLGLSAPFGKTTVFASMGRGKNKYDFDGGSMLADAKLKGKTLGVTYELSKRTSLNAYYGQVKATSEDLFTTSAEFKKTQSGFGLRHSF
jgi:predicted porin